jgi:hypothetical protein
VTVDDHDLRGHLERLLGPGSLGLPVGAIAATPSTGPPTERPASSLPR